MKMKHIFIVFFTFAIVCAYAESVKEDLDDEGEEADASEIYDDSTDEDDDFDRPLVRCKRPICEMECPNGFEVDETGCEVCRCKGSDGCEGRAVCAMFCPNGFKLDSNGCQLCECNNTVGNGNLLGRPDGRERPAAECDDAIMCMMYCDNGYKKDDNGCQVCECQDAPATERPLLGRRDGHEPTTDCEDMALCLMYCENGFKTDINGCRMCECQETSSNDRPILGRPDGHEPSSNCSQIMCRMYCDLGFQTNSFGCQICSCLENPCEGVECNAGTECRAQPCEDIHSCTRLSAKCVAVQPALQCPEPMCANYCPGGYKRNELGCMTCKCASVCGVDACDEGQICRNMSTNPLVQKCSVKTICETQRDKPLALGQTAPECEQNGAFKPMQCNAQQATCWCVDGLGHEVNETRSTVYVDEHKPRCVRNITTSMHIHMILVVKHDIDITEQLDSLNATIVDHVSSWLMIEPHYVKVTKAEPRSSSDETPGFDYDDTNADNTDEPNEEYGEDSSEDRDDDLPHQLLVELFVIHDGRTDLPSAADYMKRRIHQGQCEIPVDGGSLIPNPKTVEMEHHFAQPPPAQAEATWSEDQRYFGCWKHWTGFRIAACAVAGTLFLLVVASVILAIRRRRSRRMLHFRHHKLDSQVSIETPEKNFLNENEKQPIGHENDIDKDEKFPIA